MPQTHATGGRINLAGLDRVLPRSVAKLVRPPLATLLGVNRLNAVWDAVGEAATQGPGAFSEACLRELGVAASVAATELERLPAEGPVVLVCNHPTGGLDGLVLLALLRRRRADVKLLANALLGQVTPLREGLIYVDPFGGENARSANRQGMINALRHVRRGGVLGLFPAGEVSVLDAKNRRVVDPVWTQHAVTIARRAGAPIVCCHLHCGGRVVSGNSPLFHAAGLLNARLRTALLPREMFNKVRKPIRLRVGEPVRPMGDDATATAEVRGRSMLLGCRWQPVPARAGPLRPLAGRQSASVLRREIDQLGEPLATSGDYHVLAATAKASPGLMLELGRLREEAFRQVGEGTGQPRDVDVFDAHYTQLVLWDGVRGEIAGGYRVAIGKTPRRLYVPTLFELSAGFFGGQAMAELGRSFISPGHQKRHGALVTLWRGIGRWLTRGGGCRHLFGPVSISAAFRPASRALIATWLLNERRRDERAAHVRPRTPANLAKWAVPEVLRLANWVNDVRELDRLVSEIEPDGRGVPVLLRQYLRLGARPVAVNLDKTFGGCLDVLCVFDLAGDNGRALRRYLGVAEGSAAHGTLIAEAA
jgi:putative hemolysin